MEAEVTHKSCVAKAMSCAMIRGMVPNGQTQSQMSWDRVFEKQSSRQGVCLPKTHIGHQVRCVNCELRQDGVDDGGGCNQVALTVWFR
jgi:hypothetical protein